jgi:hypothetical protein
MTEIRFVRRNVHWAPASQRSELRDVHLLIRIASEHSERRAASVPTTWPVLSTSTTGSRGTRGFAGISH